MSTIDTALQADSDAGRKLGVSGTPTFFIGYLEGETVKVRLRLVGAQPEAAFLSALDDTLKTASK